MSIRTLVRLVAVVAILLSLYDTGRRLVSIPWSHSAPHIVCRCCMKYRPMWTKGPLP